MMRIILSCLVAFPALCGGIVAAQAPSGAAAGELSGHLRVQEIPLRSGWNAVFLEVDPLANDPSEVFDGTPVDVVAGWFPGAGPAQFVTDPGADLGKAQGWAIWYGPKRPEAFLKSLSAVYGNQAYLIHSTADFQWRVSGRVRLLEPRWQPDAFNLVGFPVRAAGGPTFAEFFAGSKAHQGQAIYRLENGAWRRIAQPAGTAMRSGEAFWIFCKGESSYEGPLKAECPVHQGVVLGGGTSSFVLRNESPHPLASVVEHVPGASRGLPLSVVVRVIGDVSAPVRPVPFDMPAGAWSQDLPPLEPGAATQVPLACRTGEMTSPRQSSLLKITTDLGTETWIPLQAVRDDLAD